MSTAVVDGGMDTAATLLTNARAVLFDVDGTLYRQGPLRALMVAEMAAVFVRNGSVTAANEVTHVIRTFRNVREDLRSHGAPEAASIDELQYANTVAKSGVAADRVRQIVSEWIFERPLKHLRLVRRPGLQALLGTFIARGVKIGALSDYPVEAKLQALGTAERFSLKLCTTDAPINAFKPHPKGFRYACEQWGLSPRDVVYVGDRPEIDAIGAAATGLHCVIVGRHRRGDTDGAGQHAVIGSFAELTRALAR